MLLCRQLGKAALYYDLKSKEPSELLSWQNDDLAAYTEGRVMGCTGVGDRPGSWQPFSLVRKVYRKHEEEYHRNWDCDLFLGRNELLRWARRYTKMPELDSKKRDFRNAMQNGVPPAPQPGPLRLTHLKYYPFYHESQKLSGKTSIYTKIWRWSFAIHI